MSSILTYRMIN